MGEVKAQRHHLGHHIGSSAMDILTPVHLDRLSRDQPYSWPRSCAVKTFQPEETINMKLKDIPFWPLAACGLGILPSRKKRHHFFAQRPLMVRGPLSSSQARGRGPTGREL